MGHSFLFGFMAANWSTVRVVIDASGVLVRSRWVPWMSHRTPLDEIAGARVTHHLSAWGQFGRGEDETGMTRIRPGEALELVFHNGKTASVSLDHADQAADILNALIVRHRTAKDPTLTS